MVTLSYISPPLTALTVADTEGAIPSTPSIFLRFSTSFSVRPFFRAVPGVITVIVPAPSSENCPIT